MQTPDPLDVVITNLPTYEVLPPSEGYKRFRRLRRYLTDFIEPATPPRQAYPTTFSHNVVHGTARLATTANLPGMLCHNFFRTC